jgi:hypothetical protein
MGVLKFAGAGGIYFQNILKLLSLENLISLLSITGISKKCVRTQEIALSL